MKINYLRMAKYGFVLVAVIWFILGVVSLIRLQSNSAVPMMTASIIAIMMFGNAAALLVCAWGVTTGKQWGYLLAIAVLLINILLTFTDQVGLMDLLTVLIDIGLLLLLVIKRAVFFPKPEKFN